MSYRLYHVAKPIVVTLFLCHIHQKTILIALRRISRNSVSHRIQPYKLFNINYNLCVRLLVNISIFQRGYTLRLHPVSNIWQFVF